MKLLVPVIAAMLLLPVNAFAQLTEEEIVNANFSGPAFLDAFWTDRTTDPAQGEAVVKTEVGPGDGASVLAVTLVNRGFSDITNIKGILSPPSGFRAAGSSGDAVATHNSVVPAGDTFTLYFVLEVTQNTQVRNYEADLTAEFSRVLESGMPRSNEMAVPFELTGKVILDASSSGGIASGTTRKVPIEITNSGSAPATGVVVTVPATTESASIVSLGQKTFELGIIPPGESAVIEPTFYASNAAGESLQAVNLAVTYGNAYGARVSSTLPVGMVVLPESSSSLVSVEPEGGSSIITAGKITDLVVTLENSSEQELADVVVSVSSQSESIKILGNTSWAIGDMEQGSSEELSTQVFASTDMIGKAIEFTYTVQHVSEGQPDIEVVELGTYVDGEISLSAYELGVTYIGGTPNITGNLLNEGNVLALFTTVELTSAEGLVDSLPPEQYLGDLTENSPLPFSIPVDVSDADAGTYPIKLQVQYKDSLRQLHTFNVTSSVEFVPEDPLADESAQSADAGMGMIAIIAVIAVAAVVAFLLVRRRKRSALKSKLQFSKQNGGSDIESVLDSQLRKPEESK
ncbi:COG1361 S-layer family protein [Candidatus Nitrososphaera sp. FF02]|uniref:COG1361 S-layer family protein n=1 Tax=Candidatus Nitrososphaera sp. FF02 TaxID=3398226 RepID=UPI0039EBAB90